MLCNPVTSLQGENLTHTQEICTKMYTGVLFVIVKNEKNPTKFINRDMDKCIGKQSFIE